MSTSPAPAPQLGRLALALVALGIVLRTVAVLRRGPFVEDELMLALNIATRGFRALLQPLDYAQTAPPLFLWAERLTVVWFGVDECGLRLLPYLAGCGSLLLLWRLGRFLLHPIELVLALGLAATSPFLLEYSAELKPYSLDGFVALWLVLLAWRLAERPAAGVRWLGLALAGLVTLAFSTPAVFVLFGIGGALLWGSVHRPLFQRRGRILLLLVTWAVAFAALYRTIYAATARDPYMRRYWEAAMLAPGPRWDTRFLAGLQELVWPVGYWLVQCSLGVVLVLACITGIGILAKRHGGMVAWLLGGPPAAMLLVSLAGRYPTAVRLSLFATLLLIVGASVGLLAGAKLLARRVLALRAVWAASLLLTPSIMVGTAWAITMPGGRSGLPRVIASFLRERRPGEPVYLFHRLSAEWAYHTTDWSRPDTARLAWVGKVAGSTGPGFVNAAPRGPRAPLPADSLVYHRHGLEEIFGVASGVQARAYLRLASSDVPAWQVTADPGWASSEVARLRRHCTQGCWAVFNHDSPGFEVKAWFQELTRVGGRVLWKEEVGLTRLYHLRFERAAEHS